jgi:hypothetical protein
MQRSRQKCVNYEQNISLFALKYGSVMLLDNVQYYEEILIWGSKSYFFSLWTKDLFFQNSPNNPEITTTVLLLQEWNHVAKWDHFKTKSLYVVYRGLLRCFTHQLDSRIKKKTELHFHHMFGKSHDTVLQCHSNDLQKNLFLLHFFFSRKIKNHVCGLHVALSH